VLVEVDPDCRAEFTSLDPRPNRPAEQMLAWHVTILAHDLRRAERRYHELYEQRNRVLATYVKVRGLALPCEPALYFDFGSKAPATP